MSDVRVTILSTGHEATDSRLLDKEAITLRDAFDDVRIVASHEPGAERLDGVEIVPLPEPTGRLDRFLFAPWRALRTCLRYPADVVHIQDAELLLICPVLKILRRSKILYDVHEDYGLLMRRRVWIPRWLRWPAGCALTAVERVLALSADGIVGVTDSLARKFWNRKKVSVYNLPAEGMIRRASEHSRPIDDRQVDLMHLGVLSGERLEFLAKILRSLIERRDGFRAMLLGLTDDQVQWCRQNLPPENVEPVGMIPYDDVAREVGNCRIGIDVHPWLQPHLMVALPMKVFEYMACGCSIVSSTMPELKNLLDAETLAALPLIEGADVECFVRHVEEILDDPARMEANRTLFQKKVHERYSWQAEGRKLVEFYRRVLPGRKS